MSRRGILWRCHNNPYCISVSCDTAVEWPLLRLCLVYCLTLPSYDEIKDIYLSFLTRLWILPVDNSGMINTVPNCYLQNVRWHGDNHVDFQIMPTNQTKRWHVWTNQHEKWWWICQDLAKISRLFLSFSSNVMFWYDRNPINMWDISWKCLNHCVSDDSVS